MARENSRQLMERNMWVRKLSIRMIFLGNFVNDRKDGYGELFYPDGRIYKGLWKKGK